MSRWRRIQGALAGALLGVFGTGIAASIASAETPPPALPAFSAERAYGYLEVLAGQIGERPAGSDAESRAVDYIAGQFKSWGLEVTLQPVPVPVWHERRARLWAEGDVTRDFPVKAVVFSGLTKPARAFAQGPRPARTVRFVAWGGHELGLMGSEKYLRTRSTMLLRLKGP